MIIFTITLAEIFGLAGTVVGTESVMGTFAVAWFDRMHAFVTAIIHEPLRRLYAKGPTYKTSFGNFGFWEGRPLHDVCDELMPMGSHFWSNNLQQCAKIYKDHEDGFIMLSNICIVIGLLYWGFHLSTRGTFRFNKG